MIIILQPYLEVHQCRLTNEENKPKFYLSFMTAKSSYQSINMERSNNVERRLPQEIKNLVAGGIAGMIAKTVVAPMDRIKILYQVTSTPFYLSHIPSVVGRIVKEEGFQALWKGNTVTMIRVVPYAGIQFMVFNKCKSYLLSLHKEEEGSVPVEAKKRINSNGPQKRDRKWDLTPVESLVAGSAAGGLSVLFTYPLDLTRAQLAVMKTHKTKHNDGFITVLFGNYRKGVSIENIFLQIFSVVFTKLTHIILSCINRDFLVYSEE